MNVLRTALWTVLVAIAFGLAGCDGDTVTVTQPASTAPVGRPIGGDPSRTSVSGVKARSAARAFLTSYLKVSYGRAKPTQLHNATSALRASLRAQQARVPEGVRNRRPRIVALRLEPVGDGRVRATATVDDGDVAPYPLFATLARSADDGRWLAVNVGG